MADPPARTAAAPRCSLGGAVAVLLAAFYQNHYIESGAWGDAYTIGGE